MAYALPREDAVLAPEAGYMVSYDGRAAAIGWISLVNVLLTLATLGVYRFWGTTRLRRHLWSRLAFNGDRLEYTGRGRELLIGFLAAILILAGLKGLVIGASMLFGFGLGYGEESPFNLLFILAIVFLIPMAIYRARRYRLSRTLWRGIRASQTGSAVKYGVMVVGLQVLTALTLGLAYPFMRTVLQRYRTENTWFGDRVCRFDGRAGDLFGKWFVAWLLIPFTLGISFVWYRVVEFRYFTSQLRFSGLGFASALKTGRVIAITVVYALALGLFLGVMGLIYFGVVGVEATMEGPDGALSAGLSNVFVISVIAIMLISAIGVSLLRTVLLMHPLLKVVSQSLTVTGWIDFDVLAQNAAARPGHGEGLADALDVGAF